MTTLIGYLSTYSELYSNWFNNWFLFYLSFHIISMLNIGKAGRWVNIIDIIVLALYHSGVSFKQTENKRGFA